MDKSFKQFSEDFKKFERVERDNGGFNATYTVTPFYVRKLKRDDFDGRVFNGKHLNNIN